MTGRERAWWENPEERNSRCSVAPGFRATLTQEGFAAAQEDAGPLLDISQFVTADTDNLTTITLPTGGYLTVGGVSFFVEARFDEKGLIKEDYRDGMVFALGYDGVVSIEGLNAGESWQNWSYNPDGSLR